MFCALTRPARTAVLPILLAATWLLLPSASHAQSFEGVIKQRTITLEAGALEELLYALVEEGEDEFDENAEEWTDEDEAKYMRAMAQKILAIPFEELLALAHSGDAELEDMTLSIKGEKIRVDTQDDESPFDYFIMDSKTATFFMVSDAQKFYVSWSAEAMKEAMAGMGIDPDVMEKASGEPAERPEVRALGKTQTINGMQCAEYGVEHDGDFIIGWVSGEHPGLHEAFKVFAERTEGMFGEDESDVDVEGLLWEKGLPVRIQSLRGGLHGFGGYEIQDLLSVERKRLSDDIFQVPAGYAEKSLKDLWGQG